MLVLDGLPLTACAELHAYNLRLKSLSLLSLTFLPTPPESFPEPFLRHPQLALLTLTPSRAPYLQTRTLNLEDKDWHPDLDKDLAGELISLSVPDLSASTLVAVPLPQGEDSDPLPGSVGAILVIGDKTITVYEPRPPTGKEGSESILESPKGKSKRRRSSAGSSVSGTTNGKSVGISNALTGVARCRAVTGDISFGQTTA